MCVCMCVWEGGVGGRVVVWLCACVLLRTVSCAAACHTHVHTRTRCAVLAGGAIPARYTFSHSPWSLVYSTRRDGISLGTLYRRAAHVEPTLLLVRDTGAMACDGLGCDGL